MRLPAKLRSGYFLIMALANQCNAVADLRFGTISHIYNSLIHGDATKNRASLSVNEDMTTVTKLQWHAVAVAAGLVWSHAWAAPTPQVETATRCPAACIRRAERGQRRAPDEGHVRVGDEVGLVQVEVEDAVIELLEKGPCPSGRRARARDTTWK